jgi:hypothetical protein
MKKQNFIHVSGIAAMAILASGLQAETVVMRDAATHEQLSLSLRAANQQDPMKSMKPSKGPDPSVNLPKSMLAESDIVSFGGYSTLVPKRAILQIPKTYADRLRFQPKSKLVGWSDFFALNRGWITTIEVSRLQAEGNAPIAAETQKQMTKSGNLIVATFLGGPISVLPLKTPETANTKKP